MAFAMSVTAETVRTYVKNVLAKVGAHSRLQLAALASQDSILIDQMPAADFLLPAGPPTLVLRRVAAPERIGTVTLTQSRPSAPPKINVLIVDQQRTFHDALAVRLRAEPDLVVAAEAQSTESARRTQAGRSADVILLDAEFPDDSSRRLLRRDDTASTPASGSLCSVRLVMPSGSLPRSAPVRWHGCGRRSRSPTSFALSAAWCAAKTGCHPQN